MLGLDPTEKQADRIDKLFRRQLAVPLLDMRHTFKEYQEYLEGRSESMDESVTQAYNRALEMLKQRETLELKLQSDADLLWDVISLRNCR